MSLHDDKSRILEVLLPCGLPLTEEAAMEVEGWEKMKAGAMKELTNPDFSTGEVFESVRGRRITRRISQSLEKLEKL